MATDEDPRLETLRRASSSAARQVRTQPALLQWLTETPPLEQLADIDVDDELGARRALRVMRTKVLVHSAFAEQQGMPTLEMAALWTSFADQAIDVADRVAYRALCAAGHVPRRQKDEAQAGRSVMALGKLGSGELNPSSDVDLLFAYETDDGMAGELSLHEAFTRWAAHVRSILADVDENGFTFRVDLDLRPEGTQGPLTNSVDAIENYYERFGQSWERAALLRLRPVAGEGEVGADVLRRLRPFVYPRNSPVAILEELADMRARIAATAGPDGFDVKRSFGGIRDVEFRVQAIQLLWGGRMPELRGGAIADLLGRMRAAGLIEHRTAVELEDAYAVLRRIEHSLQYVEDRQTQHLPHEGDLRERVARSVERAEGLPAGSFDKLLDDTRAIARACYLELFEERPEGAAPDAFLVLDRTATPKQRLDALDRLGIPDAKTAMGFLDQLAGKPASPFSPRMQARRRGARRLAARLIEHAAKSPRPLAALARLPDLFGGRSESPAVRALEQNERAAGLLVRVFAASPSLSRRLLRGATDVSVLLGSRRRRRIPTARLASVMATLPSEGAPPWEGRASWSGNDEEAALIGMRRVVSSELLRCGFGFLDGSTSVPEAGLRLSAVADAAVQRALEIAVAKVSLRRGHAPDARLAVCALGRLGGREMGFHSDLDLLFVFEGQGETVPVEGGSQRTVDVREWAARVAQQTVWALTAPLAEGACYEVDTRLRPSGSSGPLSVRLAQFVRYHDEEAALWERQALLRLRPVAGDGSLLREVRRAALQALDRPAPEACGRMLLDMRQRMIDERTRPAAGFDLKLGDGGLADVEFAVQGLQLARLGKVGSDGDPAPPLASTRRAIRQLKKRGHLRPAEAETLAEGYAFLTTFREALLLVGDGALERGTAVIHPRDSRLALLSRMGGIDLGASSGEELFAQAMDAAVRIREAASRVLLTL